MNARIWKIKVELKDKSKENELKSRLDAFCRFEGDYLLEVSNETDTTIVFKLASSVQTQDLKIEEKSLFNSYFEQIIKEYGTASIEFIGKTQI